MPGYEPCRFLQTATPKDTLCSVCTYVMSNPLTCSKCGVLTCQDCSKKCPLTCEHSFTSNTALKNKINDLSIKCKYWTKGCMEILKVGKVASHEETGCYYSQYLCGRKECEEISLPGRVKHMPECGFFMITCETCKKELKQSDKDSHKCIDWLNTIVSNLEVKTQILKEENKGLISRNKQLKEIYSTEGPELDRKIAELRDKNNGLNREIEAFKANTVKEIKELEEKGVDKMKVFHGNAETRVKSLWNRAQYDYEHLAKRVNDHLKGYLEGVNELLTEFNNKAESEDLALEGEKAPDSAKVNGNGVHSNGSSAQKAAPKPQGSGNKANSKVPVALKK